MFFERAFKSNRNIFYSSFLMGGAAFFLHMYNDGYEDIRVRDYSIMFQMLMTISGFYAGLTQDYRLRDIEENLGRIETRLQQINERDRRFLIRNSKQMKIEIDDDIADLSMYPEAQRLKQTL